MNADKHGRRAGHRPTRAEREQRVGQIFALLIAGASRRTILQFTAEKTTWNLSERSVDSLVAAATRQIMASAAFNRDLELGKAIAQLNDLYAKCHRVQDYKTCIAARKELSELLGLYAPSKIALTDTNGRTQSYVAVFPQAPESREQWAQRCQEELKAREQSQQQRAGTDPARSTTTH